MVFGMKMRLLAASIAVVFFYSSPTSADGVAASKLFADGNFDAAATAYAADLASTPNDTAAAMQLGAIRLYQNDLTDAEQLLKLARSGPDTARATRLLSELNRRRAELARRSTVAWLESDVPFVKSDPLPVIRAAVNGKIGTFVVDTGGTISLEPAFAAEAGIRCKAGGEGMFAGGKRAPIQVATIPSITLGSATAYDVPADIFPSHAGGLFADLHVDGVIGTTLFERFLVTIDYPKGRLVLRTRSPQVSAAFIAAQTQAGSTIVPCWLVGDHYVFAKARVNDAPPGLFIFDSGLAGGGLTATKALVNAANITIDPRQARSGIGGGGAVSFVPFVAGLVTVGDAVQHDVRGIYELDGPDFPAPFAVLGSISNEYLRHYAYTVDFNAMKIVLAPPS
jgi:hypothetical protein